MIDGNMYVIIILLHYLLGKLYNIQCLYIYSIQRPFHFRFLSAKCKGKNKVNKNMLFYALMRMCAGQMVYGGIINGIGVCVHFEYLGIIHLLNTRKI